MTVVMTMMRMFLEAAMVLGLVGGLLFVTKVLAKEGKLDKSVPDNDNDDDIGKSTNPDAKE